MIETVLLLALLPECPADGWITSDYGWRTHPITRHRSHHKGVDIGAPKGTPIKAMWAGRVSSARWEGDYGRVVTIDHANGLSTKYAHASVVYVKNGQQVVKGAIIAKVGSTGSSTGDHLHIEIQINGRRVDPRRWLFCPHT